MKAWEDFDVATVSKTSEVLYGLARDLIAARKAAPLDPEIDPVSSLLAATDADGAPLPEEMLVGCVRQILVVGLVAPPVFLGSVAVHLARHPELADALRASPDELEAAVEEFLRLYTPYRGFARTSRVPTVTRRTRDRGRASRSRSPMPRPTATKRCSSDPDSSASADPNVRDHLAFGRGPHRCAGMAMARTEFRIALRQLLERTRSIALDGEVRMSGMPEVGPVYVPLKVVAA